MLYRSLSGYTMKYAQWIAEELGAELFDCRKVEGRDLYGYDRIVFCGSLHIGGINGIKLIKRNFAAIAGKRIIIVVTGGSAYREGIVDEILAANFSEEQRKQLRLFYLRGGFDVGKLGLKNRVLIACRIWKLRKKGTDALTSDEADLLSAYANPADATKRDDIRSIVDYARS